jgi:hypothetical protein
MKSRVPLLLTCLFLTAIAGCGSKKAAPAGWQPGGVYAIKMADGNYLIWKVLKVETIWKPENTVCHIRFYEEMYDKVPESIDTSELGIATAYMPIPVGPDPVKNNATLITVEKITDEERSSYDGYIESLNMHRK